MDPECGKLVDPEKAIKLHWEGTTYYFCCEGCKKRFKEHALGVAGL